MIVFAGPSLAGQIDHAWETIDIRAPVRQGDVYLAVQERPAAIGIIDGYFEGVPSVWHKEILWALTQGIPVFGAASMGALRAAELDMFGMVGLGAIYEDYRDGRLEDDDEVALVHGPEELGYVALSLAMVNVRATCAHAVRSSVVSELQAEHVVARAKAQFYKARSWDSVFGALDPDVVSTDVSENLRAWIGENEVDQKRADARLLLDHLARADFSPPQVDFHFEQTNLWLRTVETWRRRWPEERAQSDTGYHLLGHREFLR